ncbi:hypothetical protein L596_010752 [Steinernema carpocapsae]|uniref:Uncharacterized protein n=1 Tax=Steinernema carpocapsae TaxID=34508 RepID=A0A4U5PJJ2_STECR|nr:hypothetical protein L596_010752 [Steinernema carpocapsae]
MNFPTSISKDVFYYWLLNLSSSFMISAAHNTLYFVLDFRTPVFHFMHHAFTCVFLVLMSWATHFPHALPKPEALLAPVGVQCVITMMTAVVHSSEFVSVERSLAIECVKRTRLTDVFSMIAVFKFLPANADKFPRLGLMLPLSIGASLSWLELGNLEYDTFGLLLSPFLGFLRGVHLVLMQKAYRQSGATSCVQFATFFTGAVAAIFFVPAVISYSLTEVKADASWESIDYTLIGLSFFFMICYKYSELFLTLNLDARIMMVLEHSKFFLGSLGQWFLQNMAHATIFSLCGKMLFVSSLLRFLARYTPEKNLKEVSFGRKVVQQ